ncbi:MAG: hypothetical protein FJ387_05895 [Verrucomicrobia bacterium]|nr:hypothetical protein [Verrucomicrobiota bacterium]
MDPRPPASRLTQQEQLAEQQQVAQTTAAAHEVGSPEELLRQDARHTTVPERVRDRLQRSIAQEPQPRKPWWRRLFGP